MKNFAILTLAIALALPASAAGVTISGYVDIGWMSVEGGRGIGGAGTNTLGQASASTNGNVTNNDGFALNEVNLDFSSQLTNDISAFASFDFIGGPAAAGADAAGRGVAGVSVDFAYVDFANPGPFDLNLRVGRIPSVIGIEQRASESPQTKFVNLSLLSPLTVGSIDGAAIYGTFSPINYAFAVSNNDIVGAGSILRPTGTGAGDSGILRPGNNNGTSNGATNNNNNSVALQGRLGIVPVEGLEVGVSGSISDYATAPTGTGRNDIERAMFGVDAMYSWGAFTVKGEYLSVDEEQANQTSIGDADARLWYVEGMYDVSSKYSVGVRFSDAEVRQQTIVNDYNTIAIAGVYRIADNVHLKAEYDINDEEVVDRNITVTGSQAEIENDVFAVSLVGVF